MGFQSSFQFPCPHMHAGVDFTAYLRLFVILYAFFKEPLRENTHIPDDISFLSVFKVCKSDHPVLRYTQKRIPRYVECKISRLLRQ